MLADTGALSSNAMNSNLMNTDKGFTINLKINGYHWISYI
ncbi:Protein of unknown function (DUF1533) [Moritella viscosa]|uniref:Uncharacterized protein n=1 Tax=Moritella viscosa TaxID=80854 RepID=A0ABY1HIT9_9GAMM|nr:Protein of unknown function (DUF1533) [Moritella viscosa]